MTNYDKRIRPGLDSGLSVNVTASMFVIRAYDFNRKDHSLKIDFYFRQKWSDPRLAFGIKGVTLQEGSEILGKIWKPDTFFSSAANVVGHLTPNSNVFLRLSPEGEVFVSQRMTADIFCSSKKKSFPTTCSLTIESYGKTTEDITYNWKKDANGASNGVMVSEETFLNEDYKLSSKEEQDDVVSLEDKNYSRVIARFNVDKD